MQEETHMKTELGKKAFTPKSNTANPLTTLEDKPATKDIAYMEEPVLLIIEEEQDAFVLRCMVETYVNTNHGHGSTNKLMVSISSGV